MKLGLDIHGVIDASPEFFSELSNKLVEDGNEVHIITGASKTEEIIKRLAGWNIKYTHFYSIVDWAERTGIEVNWTADGPTMNEFVWNTAKSLYCAESGIDVHVDDTLTYGHFFGNIRAQFIHYEANMLDMHLIVKQAVASIGDCDYYPCTKECPQYILYRSKVRKAINESDIIQYVPNVVCSSIPRDRGDLVNDLVDAIFEELG